MPETDGWDIALGQRYRVTPEKLHTDSSRKTRMVGTVVWIHPKGRFAVLACEGSHGCGVVECFGKLELTPEKRIG